jgi:Transposase DDE domain group 1
LRELIKHQTEGTFSMRSSHDLDRVRVIFDDPHAVANAGLVATATLAHRLGIEDTVDELVDLGDRPGAAHPGRKVMTLVHSIALGGDSIDDCDVLRSGSTEAVVGHRVMAPSTVGTFLRSFTFGHVRQLDKVAETVLTRAWAGGAGPGDEPLVVDFDSTVCEVHGYHKQGAAYGYTRTRGYHPLFAVASGSGEVLHARMRKGSANSSRGAVRFLDELVARVRRAGAQGELVVRADSGFFSDRFRAACRRHGVRYSVTARQTDVVRRAIEAIPKQAWVGIDYTDDGVAEVAETTYKGERLVVRRTRLVGAQAQLWPDWRHHAFATNRAGSAVDLDRDHRAHARVELAIRDLKEGSGLSHCPSGKFFANAAWLAVVALAHNLLRWVAALGLCHKGLVVAATLRRRLLAIPGRLTRSGRVRTLHLPANWPWAATFTEMLGRLRALPRAG